MNYRKLLSSLAILSLACHLSAQQTPVYKNPSQPVEARVQDLLKRMTPEEKFQQLFMVPGDLGDNPDLFKAGLFGFQVNATSAAEGAAAQMLAYGAHTNALQTAEKINSIQKYFVEKSRLGIPIIAFDEGLHGLVRAGATSFPQSIALASTWDTSLMSKVATAIAYEGKIRGIRQILSPVVNLATDVRWGRVEETYGEDPVLTSAMGVAYVSAFEKMGIITTPKHFVVNHGEGGRDSYPVDYNERLLEETYFVPFKSCIQLGGSRSIMTAYNSLNGRQCTANNWLLNQKLKKEWGFDGYVISDASATGGATVLHFTAADYEEAGKSSIENGLDVIFQTDFDHAKLFKKPFVEQKIEASKLDNAVARVLRMKFELGLFEKPYTDIKLAKNKDHLTDHRLLAKEAAIKSFVLLKNDKENILPIRSEIKKIALIGPDALEARLGGYSGPGNNKINLLDGLRKNVYDHQEINYAEGCGRTSKKWSIVKSENLFLNKEGKEGNGVRGEYFNNISLQGNADLSRTDAAINFQWTLYSPHPSINYDFFSARWTGYISSPKSGKFKVGVDGNDGYRLYIDNKLLIDTWSGQSYHTTLVDFDFEKGKKYALKIEYKEPSGNSWFRLIWDADVEDESDERIAEAVELASKSDLAIVAVGIEEGEFRDRSKLELPGKQEEMILRITATGKPVVVVLFGGSAIKMTNWLDKVNAVVEAWYPGEAGGEALAEVITGKVSPSGKLPITFPLHEGQLPLNYNHKPTGRGDDYIDGSGQPLFPFGYGLSYTQFEYTDCRISKNNISTTESTQVSLVIKNIGKMDGDEIAQLYIHDELASVVRPVKELKSFQRVSLKAGEQKTITFTITLEMLSLINEKMERVVEPGDFRIMIGSSSKDIRLREVLKIK